MTTPGTVIIERPYDSLDEYLDGDAWTVARSDMFLIGVTGLDEGLAVNFQIVLSTGEAVVSGEGRVMEIVPPTEDGDLYGVRLRFKKLDPDSKAVLRRALELQRRRAAEEAAEEAARAAASNEPVELPSSAVQDLPSSAVHEVPSAVVHEPPAPLVAEAAPSPPETPETSSAEVVPAEAAVPAPVFSEPPPVPVPVFGEAPVPVPAPVFSEPPPQSVPAPAFNVAPLALDDLPPLDPPPPPTPAPAPPPPEEHVYNGIEEAHASNGAAGAPAIIANGANGEAHREAPNGARGPRPRQVAAPPNRDALLERLRERHRANRNSAA